MIEAVVGDAHLGIKGLWPQTQVIDVFADVVTKIINAGVQQVTLPGDLFDDTQLGNELLRRVTSIVVEAGKLGLKFRILRGNHDSTRTYSATPVLDVLGELDNVWLSPPFAPSVNDGDLFIPHMKSQTEFMAAVDLLLAANRNWRHVYLHCAYSLEGGPNDMSIDRERLFALKEKCKSIFIGHEHKPKTIAPGIHRVGSMLPFTFGELGERNWILLENNELTYVPIPQPRPLVETKVHWPFDVVAVTRSLDPAAINKLRLYDVPAVDYKSVRLWMDTLADDVIWEIHKIGEKDVEGITATEARLDIRMEFQTYLSENGIEGEVAEDMTSRLEDGLRQVEIEEATFS